MGPARLFFIYFFFLFRPIAIELSSYIEREKQATCRVSCAFSSWNKREPSIEALFLEVKEHFQRSLKKQQQKSRNGDLSSLCISKVQSLSFLIDFPADECKSSNQVHS